MRHEAMNSEDITKLLARLEALMSKVLIRMRAMSFGGSKCVGKTRERVNTRETKFHGTCEHVTLMQVI